MGDLIWHLPVIRAIAARTASKSITLFTKPSTQADTLLATDPAIDRIVWFNRNPRSGAGCHDGPLGFPRLVATLRACAADTAILLHHGTSLAAALRLAGIPHRLAYGYSATQRLWLNHEPYLAPAARFTEAFTQANAFATALGLDNLPEPAIHTDPAALARARTRLAHLPQPWTALGIGCAGANRQWGAARFAALANTLLARSPGSILLLAAAHETLLATAIADAITQKTRVHAITGWPLPEIAAILSQATLFIGNDSGLLNLRAATGQPAYALFGASGPLLHSPSIRPIIPPAGPRAGMAAITVQAVLDALP